jgi:uncharacterized protein
MIEFEPVPAPQRLRTLDVLRGCALLGILMMNIPYFAMPAAAYSQLNAWGGNDGANLWTFFIQWTLFEGKMRALFSVLFGAGIILFIEHAVARRDSVEVGDLFVRRMLWLMLFGILHAWFIWYGDILYPYAICGLLIFPLRKLSPRVLFVTAAASLLLLTGGLLGDAFNKRSQKTEGTAALAAEAAGRTLTEEEKEARETWTGVLERQAPSRAQMQEEVDAYRSGYIGALEQRAELNRKFHFIPLYFPLYIDFWALMLIGMGLYKAGVLQGERPPGFYVRMAVVGYAIGLPLNATAAYLMYAWNFDFIGNEFANVASFQIGRVATVLAHLSTIVIVVKRGWLRGLSDRLAAVGRMAFSNYIAHSVICSLIFYSPGLALMGQLQRYQLYFVVFGIWAFNLLWSPWWLSRFRFGPLEWCWRSLTYWRRQAMRRSEPAAVPVGV